MGGGPDKEHMLICLWEEEPKHLTDRIREKFPHIEVTYFALTRNDDRGSKPVNDRESKVPKDLLRSATILVTLQIIPESKEEAPHLRLVHLFSAGVDHISSHPILTDPDWHVTVTTSSGIHGPPISEWVMMTTLAFSRHFAMTYEWQKEHEWGQNKAHQLTTTDWVGKRVGIAGYGSIGRQVARIFTALGADIVAYTASPRSTTEARKDPGYVVPGTGDPDGTLPSAWFSGTSETSLHTFLSANLDLVVISLPLTKSTTNLFKAKEFKVLKSGCAQPEGPFVVNIARGKIIKQDDLVNCLNDGTLRGAAVDVTEPEPLPKEDKLWDAKNVIITPHISGLGKEYTKRAFDVVIENLERQARGEELVNVVDRKKGY